MFCVVARCASIEGPKGVYTVCNTQELAERQIAYLGRDIAAGKGFTVGQYPPNGEVVVMGPEFVSRNTWHLYIIETE